MTEERKAHSAAQQGQDILKKELMEFREAMRKKTAQVMVVVVMVMVVTVVWWWW